MPIIRKQLKPDDVYPSTMRYNTDTGAFQSLINGTWTDNPAGDPRRQTLYPPRLTSNPKCDAAQSAVDAIKAEIDQTITAITNGANVTTIAGIILGLFYFGPFGVFIAIALTIARAMLDAGATALQAALTNDVYHKLVCYLECAMNLSGQIDEAGLNTVMSEMSADPGGLAAVILNATLSLAGFGGVNNLAALGTSTGNCSDCPCENWCLEVDFTASDGGFIVDPTYGFGTYVTGVGWQTTLIGGGSQAGVFKRQADLPTGSVMTKMKVTVGGTGGTYNLYASISGVTLINLTDATGVQNPEWTGTATDGPILLNPSSGPAQGAIIVTITKIHLEGTGPAPTWGSPC